MIYTLKHVLKMCYSVKGDLHSQPVTLPATVGEEPKQCIVAAIIIS